MTSRLQEVIISYYSFSFSFSLSITLPNSSSLVKFDVSVNWGVR